MGSVAVCHSFLYTNFTCTVAPETSELENHTYVAFFAIRIRKGDFDRYCTVLEMKRIRQCCGSGSGAFLTLGSGMGKKSRSGSGIRIRDEHPGSYFRELKNNFFG
jgi:hypothetical protein